MTNDNLFIVKELGENNQSFATMQVAVKGNDKKITKCHLASVMIQKTSKNFAKQPSVILAATKNDKVLHWPMFGAFNFTLIRR